MFLKFDRYLIAFETAPAVNMSRCDITKVVKVGKIILKYEFVD